MKYTIQTIVCGAYAENAYLLCNEEGCILIDPGDDLPALQAAIAGKKLCAILLTHGHFDHTISAQALSQSTGAPVYIHPMDGEVLTGISHSAYDPAAARLPFPGDIGAQALDEAADICGIHFDVLHTPGHTQGSVCYYDRENDILFSGDTLFCAGFGRTDLATGSAAQMRTSLRKLFALPENTHVYCGHGSDTTIAGERRRYRI